MEGHIIAQKQWIVQDWVLTPAQCATAFVVNKTMVPSMLKTSVGHLLHIRERPMIGAGITMHALERYTVCCSTSNCCSMTMTNCVLPSRVQGCSYLGGCWTFWTNFEIS